MTEKYQISEEFDAESRLVIGQAVLASRLPEGVSLIRGWEIDNAVKPFVVVSFLPDWEQTREAFDRGATDYVRYTPDVAELTGELNRHVPGPKV